MQKPLESCASSGFCMNSNRSHHFLLMYGKFRTLSAQTSQERLVAALYVPVHQQNYAAQQHKGFYCWLLSTNRIRIVAISAQEVFPLGERTVEPSEAALPWINPSATIHCTASAA